MNKFTDKRKNNEKKVLSLFSGCGGMDLGFEGGFSVFKKSINMSVHPDWVDKTTINDKKKCRLKKTSFKTIFANDIRPGALYTWTRYFAARGVSEGTFRLASIVDLVNRHKCGEKVFPTKVDVVTGGFPCQDFSVAGKRKGFLSKVDHLGNSITNGDGVSRGELYKWMKDVIEITRPKLFVAENVKGLVNFKDVKEIIQNDFSSISHSPYIVVEAKVLHAAEYGVPQSRERVFFIGFLKSALTPQALKALTSDPIPEEFDPYPTPTHYYGKNKNEARDNHNLAPAVVLKDIFADLMEPEESSDPSHQKYSKAKYMGRHCQGQSEINLNDIGPTIRSEHHGNIEYRRLSLEHGGKNKAEIMAGLPERRLTVRECSRIQTFPDDFEFVFSESREKRVSASEAYKLIGNAVPALLAYHIARRLEENWMKYFGAN